MNISIFTYTDYRHYLNDYCAAAKKADPAQTRRRIAAAMGIKSAGHLTLIIQGKVNVSDELAAKIAACCRLKKQETDYFLALVRYNQARSHDDKRAAFEHVVSFPRSCVYRVGAHQYKYYTRWYHSVVRALLEFIPVHDNYTELARLIVPAIRPDQARSSVELLHSLGMIEKDADGFWRPVKEAIDTGSEIPSAVVNSFILEMIERARESMDRFERPERMFAWNTVGVSARGYREIVDEIRAMRLRIGEIARKYPAGRAYQINLQVFPVSRPHEEKQ